MDFFGTIYGMFNDQKLTDVRLVSGSGGQEVMAHALVIASAVPGWKDVLGEAMALGSDPDVTLVFPERSWTELRDVVADIYSALVEDPEVDPSRILAWAEIFNCAKANPTSPPPSHVVRSRTSQRTIKKRKIFEPDVESSRKKLKTNLPKITSPTKESKRNKSKKAASKFTPALEEEVTEIENVDTNTFFHTKELISQDSGDDFTDLFKVKITKFEETKDFQVIQQQQQHYNYEVLAESDPVYDSLFQFRETIAENIVTDFEMYFKASSKEVYIKHGLKPYLPLKAKTRETLEPSIPIIVSDDFVGLFAIGVRDGENVAQALATLDEAFSQDRICQNLVQVVRHVTGSSNRHAIEFYQHKSITKLVKFEKVQSLKEKLIDLSPSDLQAALADNRKYQEDLDLKMTKLNHVPLPENEPNIKFRLVQELAPDQVLDYALVYGEDVDSLNVQTFIDIGQLKSATVALTSVFIDVMAAFCKLPSASKLYSVPHFKGLVDTNFERSCEKVALDAVITDSKSVVRRSSFRRTECPECKSEFPIATVADRRIFLNHKLSHVTCQCNIEFPSDKHFVTHMKSVHMQKKTFKCTIGKCRKRFRKQSTLDHHVAKVHDRSLEGGTGVVCDVCGEAYLNKFFLQRHHYLAHKTRKCPGCNAVVTGGTKGMYQHRAKDCPNTMPHLCPQCGQEFKMGINLNNHIRIVHMEDKDKYSCTVCSKRFACKQRLIVHMDGVHNTEKIFHCRAGSEICSVKFSTSASRKRHELKQHNLDIRLQRGGPKTSMVPQSNSINLLEDVKDLMIGS